jgi:hypothetical protein
MWGVLEKDVKKKIELNDVPQKNKMGIPKKLIIVI